MTPFMTVVAVILAAALFSVALSLYLASRALKSIRLELVSLREGVDQLRLTSRAKVGKIATGETQVVRGSRTARGRRLVVGGNENSQQYQDLQETASKAEPTED